MTSPNYYPAIVSIVVSHLWIFKYFLTIALGVLYTFLFLLIPFLATSRAYRILAFIFLFIWVGAKNDIGKIAHDFHTTIYVSFYLIFILKKIEEYKSRTAFIISLAQISLLLPIRWRAFIN